MAKRNAIAWRTDLSVEECLRRLREGTDIGVRTIFPFSGYKGKKPVLSKFDGDQFTLWKRKYYRNDFVPYFYGALTPEAAGTRIEGRFDMNKFTKIFMRVWLAFVALTGLPVVYSALSNGRNADALFGAEVAGGMLAFGFLMPKFGQLIGKGQERYLREFLETTLAARADGRGLPLSVRKIENKPLG
jgi:hypothetical protein